MAISNIDRAEPKVSVMSAYRLTGTNAVSPDQTATQEMSKAEMKAAMKDAVQKLNGMMEKSNTSVEFSLDESANLPVIKVIDKETNRVLRQLPNTEVLAFAKNLDTLKGMLLSQRV